MMDYFILIVVNLDLEVFKVDRFVLKNPTQE